MKFEIFGGEGCPYCVKAVKLVVEKGVVYTYKDINKDEEAFDQLVGRISKWKTIPQIFYGSQHIGGYDDLVKFFETQEEPVSKTFVVEPAAFEIIKVSSRESDLIEANNRYLMRAREAEYLLKEVLPLIKENEAISAKITEQISKFYIL